MVWKEVQLCQGRRRLKVAAGPGRMQRLRCDDVGVGNNARVAEPAFLLFHDPCFQHLFNGEILEPHII